MGRQSVKHAMKHVSCCLEELLTHFNGGNWALFVWGSAESLCYEVMFTRGGGGRRREENISYLTAPFWWSELPNWVPFTARIWSNFLKYFFVVDIDKQLKALKGNPRCECWRSRHREERGKKKPPRRNMGGSKIDASAIERLKFPPRHPHPQGPHLGGTVANRVFLRAA